MRKSIDHLHEHKKGDECMNGTDHLISHPRGHLGGCASAQRTRRCAWRDNQFGRGRYTVLGWRSHFCTQFRGQSDAWVAPVSPANYSGLTDGSHTFSLVGQTSGGTPSNPVFYTWVVDTLPPPMPLVTLHPSDPSGTANATFTFSDAEQGVALMCSLDGPATFCNGITTYLVLADGSHTFSVTATDTAGNQSAANVFSWTIHTTTPPSPHIDSALASLPNQIAPAFAFSDAQAGVVFTCQLDAAQPALCTSPAIYLGLADGIHTFSVIASDPNSGRSSTLATFAWTKDTTPPAGSEAEAWGAGAAPNPNR